MARHTPITLLAGSAEAHALARCLTQRLAGYPGALRAVLPQPLRNDPGDVAYEIALNWQVDALLEGSEGPVILATHPCDEALKAGLRDFCQANSRPLLHLIRPEWVPEAGDIWHLIKDASALPQTIPRGARVFVGLGRAVRDLEAALAGRYLVIRQLRAKGDVFEGAGHYLDSAAPFTVEEEIETLRSERIDWLLVRNAGGEGSWPKLAAARALGLPVAMLPRPPLMAGVPVAENVEEALAWLETL